MTNTATLTVSRSSHPDFDFIASLRLGGQQKVCQGTREQVTKWVDMVNESWSRAVAQGADVKFVRVDEFLPGDGL